MEEKQNYVINTGSFIVHVKIEDIHKDITKYVEKMLDIQITS